MTVCGIICEYNPFHKGHKYHIEKAKEITNADAIVAVMSGNFVQRGDVAVFDKKLRAKAAVKCGADLVLELPATASLCSAERFAGVSVEILNALSLVDFLAFGTESENFDLMRDVAALLCNEPPQFKEALKKHSKSGISFAAARAKSANELIEGAYDILSSPNNILAIEYLKALIKTKSRILPVFVKRKGSGYNSTAIAADFISATAARELLFNEKSLLGYVPDEVLPLYKNAKIHKTEDMSGAIIANLLKMSADEIAKIPDVSEGLENKIKKEALNAKSFGSLCDSIKSKRYAHSRIRRILLNSYLGITREDIKAPQYIKILDFNERGREVLNKAKQEARLPLVKNFNQIKALKNPLAEKAWKKELLFDRIYDLF